jgi:FkbM family methyltransferase
VLKVLSGEEASFWWSYVPATVRLELPDTCYWGNDAPELSFLWRTLKPGMTFVDVGAHHGVYALVAAKRVGEQGKVIAFEPSDRERQRLALHMRLNGVTCAKAEGYAMAAKEGHATFFAVASNSWSHLTTLNSLRRPGPEHQVREVSVETMRLDHYLKRVELCGVDVLKVDTEGAELEVFSGAEYLMTVIRPFIICEVLDVTTKNWGYPARAIIERLAERGYEWFDFQPDGTLKLHQRQDEYPEVRNYLAVPREKMGQIAQFVPTEVQ